MRAPALLSICDAFARHAQVGGAVVVSFLGCAVDGTGGSMSPDRRRLEVITEDGAALWFAMNRATATFTAEGHQTGARLTFPDAHHSGGRR